MTMSLRNTWRWAQTCWDAVWYTEVYKTAKQTEGEGSWTYFDTVRFFVQQALGCCRGKKKDNVRKSVGSWNARAHTHTHTHTHTCIMSIQCQPITSNLKVGPARIGSRRGKMQIKSGDEIKLSGSLVWNMQLDRSDKTSRKQPAASSRNFSFLCPLSLKHLPFFLNLNQKLVKCKR